MKFAMFTCEQRGRSAVVFSHGDPATEVFYIRDIKVNSSLLTVVLHE